MMSLTIPRFASSYTRALSGTSNPAPMSLESFLADFNDSSAVKAEALGNNLYRVSANGTQIKVKKETDPRSSSDYILTLQDLDGKPLFKIKVIEKPQGHNLHHVFLQISEGGTSHQLYREEAFPMANIVHAIRQVSPHAIVLNDIRQGFDDPSQIQVKSQSNNTYVLEGKNTTTIKVTSKPNPLHPGSTDLRLESIDGTHIYTVLLDVLGTLGGNKQYNARITQSGPDEKYTADGNLPFEDLQAFYHIAVKANAL